MIGGDKNYLLFVNRRLILKDQNIGDSILQGIVKGVKVNNKAASPVGKHASRATGAKCDFSIRNSWCVSYFIQSISVTVSKTFLLFTAIDFVVMLTEVWPRRFFWCFFMRYSFSCTIRFAPTRNAFSNFKPRNVKVSLDACIYCGSSTEIFRVNQKGESEKTVNREVTTDSHRSEHRRTGATPGFKPLRSDPRRAISSPSSISRRGRGRTPPDPEALFFPPQLSRGTTRTYLTLNAIN